MKTFREPLKITAIETGFLDGDLGDISPDEYIEALEATLQEKYPGVAITIRHQAASGSLPAGLRTYVTYENGEVGDPQGHDAQAVDELAGDAFVRLCERL